ncbi:MAG: hypothetical protein RDU76_01535 [Candidatus Edwardsbacteria bacterium]|nr:hypothetical protein [Candidatus Edwardsbacteria bacterium]
MKCLITLLLLLVATGCSKTPLDHAKKAVSKNIGQYLNDPSYYESVSWNTLDSVFYEKYFDTPRASKVFDSCALLIPLKKNSSKAKLQQLFKLPMKEKYLKVYRVFTEDEGISGEKIGALWRLVAKNYYAEEDTFKPYFKGYKIGHTFRARGPKKERVLIKYIFTLDSTFNVIDAEKLPIEAFDNTKP